MAANMQHMAGPGQMMQQQRRPPVTQIQQLVYQNLLQNTQNYPNGCWQAVVQLPDRMGKIMNLYAHILHPLRMGRMGHLRQTMLP